MTRIDQYQKGHVFQAQQVSFDWSCVVAHKPLRFCVVSIVGG